MTLTLADGVYEESLDDASAIVRAMTAGAGPVAPPDEWFEDPKLDKLTPLTVTADGRVFGHIADWNMPHIGLPGVRRPPRSAHNYAFFKTGVVACASGKDVEVGQLTVAGGHAPLEASAGQAVKHYDDTASAVVDINVGEDAYGIWAAGAVRPDATAGQIRALRASAPSGDWRPINNALELVAVCQVNTPGFPIPRSLVAGGEIQSLVAAGAPSLYALRQEEMLGISLRMFEDRIQRVEDQLGMTASASAVTQAASPEASSDSESADDSRVSGADIADAKMALDARHASASSALKKSKLRERRQRIASAK